MTEENTQITAATPTEPAASPERAGASAPVDGGQPNGEATQPTEQAQPADGGEGAQPNEGQGGPKPTPDHRSVNGRISHYQKETVREREARIRAEARAETLERLLANGGVPKAEAASQAPAKPEGPPNPADFPQGEFGTDYLKAVARWEAREELRAEREASARASQDAAEQETLREGLARLDDAIDRAHAAAETNDGFQNAPRFLDYAKHNLGRQFVDLVTTAENPIHVAEWCGRNPDAVRALSGKNAVEQARAIARLDTQISINRKAASAQPAPTPAPKPAPTPQPAAIPTAPAGGASLIKDPNKMSMEEYAAWRNSAG